MTSHNNDSRSPFDLHEPIHPQSYPEVTSHYVSFDLSDHLVDGVGRGSVQDLMFRPNAHFHPVREIQREGQMCRVHFDKSLTEINRPLTQEEIVQTVRALRQGLRECALGQKLYLYPGIESFAFNGADELRVVLINVRPQHRFLDYNVQHLSVIAFLELARACSPDTWKKLKPHTARLSTLAALEAHLTEPSALSRIFSMSRALLVVAIWLLIASIPLAIFGPPEMRTPLRQALHPLLMRASELLQPAEHLNEDVSLEETKSPEGSEITPRPTTPSAIPPTPTTIPTVPPTKSTSR